MSRVPIDESRQPWLCESTANKACIISWSFIRVDIIVLAVCVAACMLIYGIATAVLYIQRAVIAERAQAYGGLRQGAAAQNQLAVLAARNPRALLLAHIGLQILPSFIVCFIFIWRAMYRSLTPELYFTEVVFNFLFLAIFFLRFAARPQASVIFGVNSIVDMLSIGSFAVLLLYRCDWPAVPPGAPSFVVGRDCVAQPTGVLARTWFSFGYLRAVYARDVFDIVEQLTTPARRSTSDSSREGSGIASESVVLASGDDAQVMGFSTVAKRSPLTQSLSYQVGKFMTNVLAVLFIIACSTYCLELLGEIPGTLQSSLLHLYRCEDGSVTPDPDAKCDETFSIFTAMYFSVVTLATVGYGDLSPHFFPSRAFVTIAIIAGVGLFARWLSDLIEVVKANRIGNGSYDADVRGRHVVIAGSPSLPQIVSLLSELFHANYGALTRMHAVFLLETRSNAAAGDAEGAHRTAQHEDLLSGHGRMDSVAVRSYLTSPEAVARWGDRLVFLEGSAMNHADLDRADACASEAIFIMPNRFARDTRTQDAGALLHTMSVKRYLATARGRRNVGVRALRVSGRVAHAVAVVMMHTLWDCGYRCNHRCSRRPRREKVVHTAPEAGATLEEQAQDESGIAASAANARADDADVSNDSEDDVGSSASHAHPVDESTASSQSDRGSEQDGDESIPAPRSPFMRSPTVPRAVMRARARALASAHARMDSAELMSPDSPSSPGAGRFDMPPRAGAVSRPFATAAAEGAVQQHAHDAEERDTLREACSRSCGRVSACVAVHAYVTRRWWQLRELLTDVRPADAASVLVLMQLCTDMLKPQAIAMGVHADNIVVCETFAMGLSAASCLHRSVNTVMTNLIVSHVHPREDAPHAILTARLAATQRVLTHSIAADAAWMAEYQDGSSRSVFTFHPSRRYTGMRFAEFVTACFKASQGRVCVIGMDLRQPDGSKRLLIAPPADAIVMKRCKAYVIADDETSLAAFSDAADDDLLGPQAEDGDSTEDMYAHAWASTQAEAAQRGAPSSGLSYTHVGVFESIVIPMRLRARARVREPATPQTMASFTAQHAAAHAPTAALPAIEEGAEAAPLQQEPRPRVDDGAHESPAVPPLLVSQESSLRRHSLAQHPARIRAPASARPHERRRSSLVDVRSAAYTASGSGVELSYARTLGARSRAGADLAAAARGVAATQSPPSTHVSQGSHASRGYHSARHIGGLPLSSVFARTSRAGSSSTPASASATGVTLTVEQVHALSHRDMQPHGTVPSIPSASRVLEDRFRLQTHLTRRNSRTEAPTHPVVRTQAATAHSPAQASSCVWSREMELMYAEMQRSRFARSHPPTEPDMETIHHGGHVCILCPSTLPYAALAVLLRLLRAAAVAWHPASTLSTFMMMANDHEHARGFAVKVADMPNAGYSPPQSPAVVILHPLVPTASEWAQLQPYTHAHTHPHGRVCVLPREAARARVADDVLVPTPTFSRQGSENDASHTNASRLQALLDAARKHTRTGLGTVFHVCGCMDNYHDLARVGILTAKRILILSETGSSTTVQPLQGTNGAPAVSSDAQALLAYSMLRSRVSACMPMCVCALTYDASIHFTHESRAAVARALRGLVTAAHMYEAMCTAQGDETEFVAAVRAHMQQHAAGGAGEHVHIAPRETSAFVRDLLDTACAHVHTLAPSTSGECTVATRLRAMRLAYRWIYAATAVTSRAVHTLTGPSLLVIPAPGVLTHTVTSAHVRHLLAQQMGVAHAAAHLWPPGNMAAVAGMVDAAERSVSAKHTPARAHVHDENEAVVSTGVRVPVRSLGSADSSGGVGDTYVLPECVQGVVHTSSVCDALLAAAYYEPHITTTMNALVSSPDTHVQMVRVPIHLLITPVSSELIQLCQSTRESAGGSSGEVRHVRSASAPPARFGAETERTETSAFTVGAIQWGVLHEYMVNKLSVVPIGIMRHAAKYTRAAIAALTHAAAQRALVHAHSKLTHTEEAGASGASAGATRTRRSGRHPHEAYAPSDDAICAISEYYRVRFNHTHTHVHVSSEHGGSDSGSAGLNASGHGNGYWVRHAHSMSGSVSMHASPHSGSDDGGPDECAACARAFVYERGRVYHARTLASTHTRSKYTGVRSCGQARSRMRSAAAARGSQAAGGDADGSPMQAGGVKASKVATSASSLPWRGAQLRAAGKSATVTAAGDETIGNDRGSSGNMPGSHGSPVPTRRPLHVRDASSGGTAAPRVRARAGPAHEPPLLPDMLPMPYPYTCPHADTWVCADDLVLVCESAYNPVSAAACIVQRWTRFMLLTGRLRLRPRRAKHVAEDAAVRRAQD